MENGHLHDDKLFRAVHDRLSDYEVPYNGTDWDAMSRSLDQLPKTSRFQWKISLNTLLAGVGIVGISLLGLLLAGSSGKAKPSGPQPEATTETVVQPAAMTMNTSQQPVVSNDPAPQNATENPAAKPNAAPEDQQQATGTRQPVVASGSKAKHTQTTDKEKLLFGDQIDRRKGFIYQTQEDKKIIDEFHGGTEPTVYYGVDHGQVETIHIHKDSTGVKGVKTPVKHTFSSDSTATNTAVPGTPTDGERHGFEYEGNR